MTILMTKTNNLIMEKRMKNIQTFEQMNLNEKILLFGEKTFGENNFKKLYEIY